MRQQRAAAINRGHIHVEAIKGAAMPFGLGIVVGGARGRERVGFFVPSLDNLTIIIVIL